MVIFFVFASSSRAIDGGGGGGQSLLVNLLAARFARGGSSPGLFFPRLGVDLHLDLCDRSGERAKKRRSKRQEERLEIKAPPCIAAAALSLSLALSSFRLAPLSTTPARSSRGSPPFPAFDLLFCTLRAPFCRPWRRQSASCRVSEGAEARSEGRNPLARRGA